MSVDELITKSELEKTKDEIIQAIKEQLTTIGGNNKRWLRSTEVQELLGLSASGLQNLRVNGILPYTKLSGVIYYDSKEIESILDKNRVNG
jgi:hypothetical protein